MALQLKEPIWRSAVAVFGLVLSVIAGYGMIREGPDQSATPRDYGLKITSPGENANVPEEFAVEGTDAKRPPVDATVRLFVYSPQSGNYWPSSRPILFDEANQRWRSLVRPAGPARQEKVIGIAVLGQNSRVLCRYYDAVTDFVVSWRKTLNQHVGLPGVPELPRDFKECHKIRVNRV